MNKKQSLFHIAKRDTLPWYKSFAIRGCAILLALVVCAVVTMLLTGENPVNIFATIFKGAFGSARKSWVTFQNLAVLLGISLAVTPAFKMRFWNIGAEGQVLIGCLATAACMICLADKLPNAVLILVSLAAALAAGALWGFLPAFFKAKWNTNETLFTLMMNYIATQLAAFFIIVWEVPKGAGKIGIINLDEFFDGKRDHTTFAGTGFSLELIRRYGIRVSELGDFSMEYDLKTPEQQAELANVVRFAIDRSRLTQEHLDYVIAAVKALYEDRESIPNMRIVWGHKLPMRHFHAFLEPYANEEK